MGGWLEILRVRLNSTQVEVVVEVRVELGTAQPQLVEYFSVQFLK